MVSGLERWEHSEMSAEAEERPWVPAATSNGRQSEKGKILIYRQLYIAIITWVTQLQE